MQLDIKARPHSGIFRSVGALFIGIVGELLSRSAYAKFRIQLNSKTAQRVENSVKPFQGSS